MRDMSLNDELYTPDLRYKDPTTFGRILVGLDEFVKYNFAAFNAIPDLRYDPLPGQVYIDFTPGGEVRMVVRYLVSGHWSGPLRVYPYDETTPAIHGLGIFVQSPAIDRYHFTKDGRMYEGETVYDAFDATQSAGILPHDDSWPFRVLMNFSLLPGIIGKIRKRIPLRRGE